MTLGGGGGGGKGGGMEFGEGAAKALLRADGLVIRQRAPDIMRYCNIGT